MDLVKLLACVFFLGSKLLPWQFAGALRPTEENSHETAVTLSAHGSMSSIAEVDLALARTAAGLRALNVSAASGMSGASSTASTAAARTGPAEEQQSSPHSIEEDRLEAGRSDMTDGYDISDGYDSPSPAPAPEDGDPPILEDAGIPPPPANARATGVGVMRGILFNHGIQYVVTLDPSSGIYCKEGEFVDENKKVQKMQDIHTPMGLKGEKCFLGFEFQLVSIPNSQDINVYGKPYDGFLRQASDAGEYPGKVSMPVRVQGHWIPQVPAFSSGDPDRYVGVMDPLWKISNHEESNEEKWLKEQIFLPWYQVSVLFDSEGATVQYTKMTDADRKIKLSRTKRWPMWSADANTFRMNRLPAGKDTARLYHGMYFYPAGSGNIVFTAEIDLVKWKVSGKDGETLEGDIDWRLQQVPPELLDNEWQYIGDRAKSHCKLKKEQGEKAVYVTTEPCTVSCNENQDSCEFLQPERYEIQFASNLVLLKEQGGGNKFKKLEGNNTSQGVVVVMLPIWKSQGDLATVATELNGYDPRFRNGLPPSRSGAIPTCGGKGNSLGEGQDIEGGLLVPPTGELIMVNGVPVPAVRGPDGNLVAAERNASGQLTAPDAGFFGSPVFVGSDFSDSAFQMGFDREGQNASGLVFETMTPDNTPVRVQVPDTYTYPDPGKPGHLLQIEYPVSRFEGTYHLSGATYAGRLSIQKMDGGQYELKLQDPKCFWEGTLRAVGEAAEEYTGKYRSSPDNRLVDIKFHFVGRALKGEHKINGKWKEIGAAERVGEANFGGEWMLPNLRRFTLTPEGNNGNAYTFEENDLRGKLEAKAIGNGGGIYYEGMLMKGSQKEGTLRLRMQYPGLGCEFAKYHWYKSKTWVSLGKAMNVMRATKTQPMLMALPADKPSQNTSNQEPQLRGLNPGCWVFQSMGSCTAHKDGRQGEYFSNSPCCWCCGKACIKNQGGGGSLCMAKKVLKKETPAHMMCMSGDGEDTCNGDYSDQGRRPGHPGMDTGLFDVKITGELPKEKDGKVKVQAPDKTWWYTELPEDLQIPSDGVTVTIVTRPLRQ